MLAKRLTKQGVAFSSGPVAVVLATAPSALVASTIQSVTLLAAGKVAAPGIISAQVSDLTEGVVNAMFMNKIRSMLTVVLVVGLALGGIGLGVGLATNPPAVAQPEAPKEAPVKKESPAPPAAAEKVEKPPHVVEKHDKKGRDPKLYKIPAEIKLEEEHLLVATKHFMGELSAPGADVRFRDYFDPRYLKKHGLTDRDTDIEILPKKALRNMTVADDLQTVLCVIEHWGEKQQQEVIILRWVRYEDYLYLSPEKAPDPKTGIFTPWILRTKAGLK